MVQNICPCSVRNKKIIFNNPHYHFNLTAYGTDSIAFSKALSYFSGQTIQSFGGDTGEHFINGQYVSQYKKLVRNVILFCSSHLHGCGGLAKWLLSTNGKHTFHTLLVNLIIYMSLLSCRSLSSLHRRPGAYIKGWLE